MTLGAICIDRQMIRSQMRVPAHHALGLPSGGFLQREEWRSALLVPACPGGSQIAPVEVVLDTRARKRLVLSPRARIHDRLSFVAEHQQRMLA